MMPYRCQKHGQQHHGRHHPLAGHLEQIFTKLSSEPNSYVIKTKLLLLLLLVCAFKSPPRRNAHVREHTTNTAAAAASIAAPKEDLLCMHTCRGVLFLGVFAVESS